MMDDPTYEVGYVEVLAKGGKALLVDVEGEEIWIPFSQIDESSDIDAQSEPEDAGDLVVTMWLAEQEGWV